jgi:hypothetical protein
MVLLLLYLRPGMMVPWLQPLVLLVLLHGLRVGLDDLELVGRVERVLAQRPHLLEEGVRLSCAQVQLSLHDERLERKNNNHITDKKENQIFLIYI